MSNVRRRSLAARASPGDYKGKPPVFCNSFPKSGTHLLQQILEAIPGVENRHAFWASTPSFTFRERSADDALNMVSRVVPGELICGHLHFDQRVAASLAEHQVVHYFIYRDLRDVAISEAHYLANMNRWHKMHRFYRDLPDDEARIALAIRGREDRKDIGYDYPSIAERFMRFHGWLGRDDVMPVKFEDLVSENREQAISRIVRFYMERSAASCGDGAIDAAVARAVANIDPARSYTFRTGKAGCWRDTLSAANRQLMDDVAGPLLEELGYGRSTALH